jgi:hypothetical protein
MAALDFPLVPTTESEVTTGDITWKWNGYAWYSTTDSTQVIFIGSTPPDPAIEGQMWWADTDVDEGGGRLYIYTGDEWVDTSLPGGGFSGDYNDLTNQPDLFSGDYDDLTNKPNIPDGFDLEDGSEINNLIVWRNTGEVIEAEVPSDAIDQLNFPGSTITYTDMPTTTNGSGTGMTVTYTASNNPVQLFKVAFPGSGYEVGDTFQVFDPDGNDRGFGGTVNETSSSAGEHPGPGGESGWYPEVGNEYYVSTRKDSVVDASPRFLGNTVFGLRPEGELLSEEGKVSIYPIGGRSHTYIRYVTSGAIHHSHYKTVDTDDTAIVNFNVHGGRLSDNVTPEKTGELKSRFRIDDAIHAAITNGYTFRVENINDTSTFISLDPQSRLIKFAGSTSNGASLSSGNGKYNFRKKDGTTNGYQINAEGGSAGFVLAEDSANPANYDAEGEYIGPIKDRVADLIARVSAIESNEVADDAVDSALLTLVASLSQRLDERDIQIAALTSRITALEGA